MSKRTDIIKGMEILERYDPDGWCDAQHDIIYGGPISEVSEEDAEKLKSLGWHFDEQYDSWACFT